MIMVIWPLAEGTLPRCTIHTMVTTSNKLGTTCGALRLNIGVADGFVFFLWCGLPVSANSFECELTNSSLTSVSLESFSKVTTSE